MVAIVKNPNEYTLNSRHEIITPYLLYLLQVQGDIDSIRQRAVGFDYLPPQFGGYMNQRKVLEEQVVLQVTDFKVL